MAICQFCKGEARVFIRARDYNRRISLRDFDYVRCPACKLISISAVPDDLGHYYTQEYYRIPSLRDLKKVADSERYKIAMVRDYCKSGRLLEIGPAFGVFAYQAKQAGFEVDAIEMNDKCCRYLKETVGINVYKSDVPHRAVAAMRKHDVIALWHVLEHLVNPWECLSAMVENLNPHGILVIATPNPDAFQFRLLGRLWPHVDAPRHVHLIPEKVLSAYLKRLGMEPVKVTANDKGGRSWNRFGWQRYLMNRFSGKWMQAVCFIAGYLLSIPFSLWELQGLNGCAYTSVFKKKVPV